MTRQNNVMPQNNLSQNSPLIPVSQKEGPAKDTMQGRSIVRHLGLSLSSISIFGVTIGQAQATQAPVIIQEAAPAVNAEAVSGKVPTAIAPPETLAPETSLPKVTITPSPEVPQIEIEIAPQAQTTPAPAYIDQNLPAGDYSAPTEVQITERSSGCEAQLKWGQSLASSFCGGGTAVVAPVAERGGAAPPVPPANGNPSGLLATPLPPAEPASIARQSAPQAPQQYAEPVAQAPLRLGPISISSAGISLSAPSSIQPYFPGKLIQLPNLANLPKLNITFPVAIPAPITSLFGWRVHPITGAQRMHTGTDIGAPMGTPVLAALSGKVILAGDMGGYGLAVAIEHDNGVRQTLYGHMSELFVKPGELVNQGTVIGRVGSTGASTGPHLHFELRQMTADGTWIAQDAGNQLELSLSGLVQSLQVAQKPQAGSIKAAVRPTLTQPIAPMKLNR
jgi:murein DD-endopeptidase MepM/ murein hydrolase activator NlpD